MVLLSATDFSFEILHIKCDETVTYNNTLMDVTVTCKGFSGTMQMEVAYDELLAFARDMEALHETVGGMAEIKEPFGYQSNNRFECKKTGHIAVSGELYAMDNEMKFGTIIDQTEIKAFVKSLCNMLSI